MRRAPRALALAACLALGACKSDDPWTFAVSRTVYESSPSFEQCEHAWDATAAAIFLALPLVLDVVFLPVALPHDLVVHGEPW